MTDRIPTPGELAERLDRRISALIADAIDGDLDHAAQIELLGECQALALTSVLLGQRQSQLDPQEKTCTD